jgi:RimJ/RimL family protein N-acetyltransferase
MNARSLPYVLNTSRLVLRPFEFGDVDDIAAYAADEEWGRCLSGTPQPHRREDAVQHERIRVTLRRIA